MKPILKINLPEIMSDNKTNIEFDSVYVKSTSNGLLVRLCQGNVTVWENKTHGYFNIGDSLTIDGIRGVFETKLDPRQQCQ